jgi:hypothetical protein
MLLADYLARTGLSAADFGRRIGYSKTTLGQFACDRYYNISRSARALTAAIRDYIAAHPIAAPVRLHGDLYETANVKTIRDTFQRLLPKPVAYMIYAPPGSQKTFVLEHEVARLNLEELSKNGHGRRAYYVYSRQGIRPRDLLKRVAIACGSAGRPEVDATLLNLRHDFEGRRVLLIVDEAQHLSLDCFEVLRELLDQPPYFSLLFAGSHDLKAIFDKFSATLEQWNSRIIAKVRLPGLQREEGRAIVRREIGHLLAARDERDQRRIIDSLIDSATVADAYADNATYINVRTLTNALEQIKTQAETQPEAAQQPAPEEAVA